MTPMPVHPLLLFLMERRVGIGEGAALLGLSERMLREVLAGRARLSWQRAQHIAADLGSDVAVLFPESS